MEGNNYHQGDLTDIVRATGGNAAAEWQFPSTNPMNYASELGRDDFGDPFIHFGDPLLHGIGTPAVSGFFHGEETGSAVGFVAGDGENNICTGPKISLDHDEMKRPNFFSRMLQISPVGYNAKFPVTPCDSPASGGLKGPLTPVLVVSNDQSNLISPNSSKSCSVESSGNLQISSPRNTGIRRRKSQAKKVVCIPAPAPANSRPSGEIVPSDLWAWRKYGQKPIKGSPYPRGYYRCSSSKGCSARKQVERSRTDPNMLVITYTSEHNHPWPTQRNALAGSTRSQPSKNNNTTASKSPSAAPQKCPDPKDEQKGVVVGAENMVPSSSSTVDPNHVKEEKMDHGDFDRNDRLEMDGSDFDQAFTNSYRPALPDSSHNQSEDSFFADLGEIEADSLDIFGFSGDDGGDNKGNLDPFGFYDWAVNNNNNDSAFSSGAAASYAGGVTTSFGDASRDS